MTQKDDVQGLTDASTFGVKLRVNSGSDIDDIARSNRRILIQAYEAQIAGDIEAWWSIFDPDVEFHEASSLPYGGSLKGLEAAKQGMGAMFEAWRDVQVDFENFLAAGDLVIAYLRMHAVSRRTGDAYDAPVAEVFRFRNGKVIEWRPIYWDTHEVRKVCGEA